MKLETIDPSTETEIRPSRQFDADVSACFRALYRRVRSQADGAEPIRVVGVVGCRRGEGVSTVAGRLAIAAAQQEEQPVLLIDANPWAPSVHRTFHVNHDPGLLNLIDGSCRIDQATQASSLHNLWVLPLGKVSGSRLPADTTTRVAEAISALSLEFSLIVVDLAPTVEIGDVLGVTTVVDGVVLVVEAESTRRSLVREAASSLSQVRILGSVLNKRREFQ